jgi:uroporphyrinogen-III synthase
MTLAGRRVLVTRAREQAGPLARLLEARGAEVILVPTIEIVPPQSFQPLDKALQKIHGYDWLILTSVNGVQALKKRMDRLDLDSGLLRRLKVAAIGPATRDALEALGIRVELVPDEYVAESIVAALRDRVPGQSVLLVRAKVARDVIPQRLREAGAQVDVVEAYATVLPSASRSRLGDLLQGPRRPHIITFTSSSTARNFISLLPPGKSPKVLLEGMTLASIGPVTSQTLREVGLWVDVEAKEFTIPGLVQALTTE